jgi:glycerol uptake facilitator-like aquaporin
MKGEFVGTAVFLLLVLVINKKLNLDSKMVPFAVGLALALSILAAKQLESGAGDLNPALSLMKALGSTAAMNSVVMTIGAQLAAAVVVYFAYQQLNSKL